MGKHIRERRLARRIEVPKDIAEMNDARRYQVNGGVLKMLVEAVVVAVANDGIRNRLSIGNLVIGLPANLGQGVVAAALEWQSRGELQNALPDRVAETRLYDPSSRLSGRRQRRFAAIGKASE